MQMNFTPLVSPAVTPHDARFQMAPDYTTVPGAYFSPLTSPALDGQHHPMGSHTPQFHPSGPHSSSSNTASPIDIDVEMLGESIMPHPPLSANRKSTRKRPGTSGSSTARVRQSPIVKARDNTKRKSTISGQMPPKEVAALLEQAQKSQMGSPMQQGLSIPTSQATSDVGSISPEPLSEAVMGPPPKPGSAIQSPAISAQNDQSRSGGGVIPATPASLMRIAKGMGGMLHSGAVQSHMSPLAGAELMRNASSLEDLTLPESAVGPAGYSSNNGATTPRASARPTPKLGPLTTSASSTPLVSPLTPGFPASGATKRGSTAEPKGRGKKRNSNSISEGRPAITGTGGGSTSTLISPALRPKISPSIKPLQASGPTAVSAASTPTNAIGGGPISGGPTGALTISEQTAHLLLASKSNYQHLVDGTNVNVPGLEYPESLSTGLTSKRTSHKIAEQGRRNRINVALAEMGRLLPPELKSLRSPVIGALDGKDEATSPIAVAAGSPARKANGAVAAPATPGPNGSAAANAGHSKAATVESAIVYIRLLQQQAEERESRIREKEAEILGLRRRLGDGSGSSAAGGGSAADEAEVDGEDDADVRKTVGVAGAGMEVVVERNEVVRAEDAGKDSDIDVDGRMEDG